MDIPHVECAGPCVEAGSRAIWSRECGRGRWARLARRPGSASQCCASVSVRDGCASVNRVPGGPVRGHPSYFSFSRSLVRARACPRCLAVWPPRCLAVWPLLTLGVWPYGLWTLAAWRCLICARSRLGLRSSRGRMVCNLPRSLPHTCSRPLVVPHVPSPPPGLRLPLRRASWALSPLVASGYEPRRLAARMRRAVMWIQWGLGLGV